ncbi:hypothetical protein HanXRQr2_Chr04g0178031 [Helianthus annuus]|uniref:Uncharacterized protein n=1 Tax=Helianthus annuus TaxID=4232 RepID=A0A9K3NSF9_HELAN|nr:hypothetical protein HanXRQr2_Chr04g0178031 [Helianthus annuus]KAJ0932279.1 hypothetical protein HanPSC8_Chr04g0171831 [Helianthus annuus]
MPISSKPITSIILLGQQNRWRSQRWLYELSSFLFRSTDKNSICAGPVYF